MLPRIASLALLALLGSSVGCKDRANDGADQTGASQAGAPELEAALAEADRRAAAMQASLQAALLAAIEADGPAAAIAVCRSEAPKLSAAQSGEGWTISRTSLRVRNPDNAPTEWQRAVLEDFDRRQREGADASTLRWHEIVEDERGATLRVMKAIPTGGLCLSCHGNDAQISPEVEAKLTELYPNDQATGFAAGQVRGAFVIIGPLSRDR